MKRSNRLVILVGVLLAVLAFVGMVILLNQGGPTSVGPVRPTTKVLVATQDIAIDDVVTPAMVKVIEVDPSAVERTPLSDPSQLRNRAALEAVTKGAQVPAEIFGQVGKQVTTAIADQLKAGEKAIAFQVDSVTGIDFLITKGDVVDIVFGTTITVLQPTADSAANPSAPQRFEVVAGLESSRTVKTVLQAKRVLYVSDTKFVSQQAGPTPTPSDGSGGGALAPAIDRVVVVIAGTDADAELIKFAQNDATVIGPMTVVLRNPKDTAVEKTLGLTIDSLIRRYGVPIPDIVQNLKTK